MFGSVVGAWVLLAASAAPPALNDQTYARWRDHIRPKPAEVNWEEVPWRATLWDAVVEARKRDTLAGDSPWERVAPAFFHEVYGWNR